MGMRARRLTALVLVAGLSTGCLAPSYLRPSAPYSDKEHGAVAQVYFFCYDVATLMQLYPLLELGVTDSVLSDTVLTIAMPFSFVGSIVLFIPVSLIALFADEAEPLDPADEPAPPEVIVPPEDVPLEDLPPAPSPEPQAGGGGG